MKKKRGGGSPSSPKKPRKEGFAFGGLKKIKLTSLFGAVPITPVLDPSLSPPGADAGADGFSEFFPPTYF